MKKKKYIYPAIDVFHCEAEQLLQSSKDIMTEPNSNNGGNNLPGTGINTGEGDGGDGNDAKRGHGITWDYNSKYDWDY